MSFVNCSSSAQHSTNVSQPHPDKLRQHRLHGAEEPHVGLRQQAVQASSKPRMQSQWIMKQLCARATLPFACSTDLGVHGPACSTPLAIKVYNDKVVTSIGLQHNHQQHTFHSNC
jgi:hypothetical protein